MAVDTGNEKKLLQRYSDKREKFIEKLEKNSNDIRVFLFYAGLKYGFRINVPNDNEVIKKVLSNVHFDISAKLIEVIKKIVDTNSLSEENQLLILKKLNMSINVGQKETESITAQNCVVESGTTRCRRNYFKFQECNRRRVLFAGRNYWEGS